MPTLPPWAWHPIFSHFSNCTTNYWLGGATLPILIGKPEHLSLRSSTWGFDRFGSLLVNRSIFSQTTFVVGWLLGMVAAAMASSPEDATAQITITVPSVSVPESSSSQTGTFDVYVVTSGGSLPQVGDFSVNLQLSPAGGVAFTGGAATSIDPYIFAGQTPGPTVDTFNSGTTIEGTDFAATPPTLVNGDGLLAVNYSVPANTSGTFNLTLVTTGLAATALDDQNANPIPFTVQNATLTVVPSAAYWNGTLGTNWNTLSGASFATNWSTTAAGGTDTHALPGATTDVFFTTSGGGSNLSTTLGAPLAIKGLTLTSAATNPVSIGGSALTIGADGLTVQSGAAAATINSSVTLSSSQSWTVAGSNPVTVNGTLSLAGQTLTKAGNGTVRVDSAPSLGSGSSVAVNAGTLQLDVTSGAPTIGSNVSATVATGATLQLAGSVSALSDVVVSNPPNVNLVNITNNGSTASGGGLQVIGTNQAVGVVSGQATTNGGATTYGGDTTVGNGTTAASLTVTQLLQNTLTINAGSTVTILPSGSGSQNGSGNASASASSTANVVAVSTPAAPAVVSLAPSVSTSSATVVASAPAAATPAASVSDPFLGVQAAIGSGSNSAAASAAIASAVAPVQAAIASVAADSSLPDVVASSAVVADTGGVLPSSLLTLGQASAADDTALNSVNLISADDNALLGSQTADSLAFAASPSAGLAALGAASPMLGGMNVVPEPSSFVLLLIGCTIAAVFFVRRRAAEAAVGQ